MTDYFARARRQGASRYIAGIFEGYVMACDRNGVKPLPCKRFLEGVDYTSVENVITDSHGTSAGHVLATMRVRGALHW